MPTPASGYGLQALVMLARANGGGEQNIDPGFKALRDEIAPNVLAYEPSLDRLAALFVGKQARIVVWGSGRSHYFAEAGLPAGFVSPREGMPAMLSAACATARPERNERASNFVKALLQPGLQRLFLRDFGWAPAAISAGIQPPAEVPPSALVTLDWIEINRQRAAWTERWKRDIDK